MKRKIVEFEFICKDCGHKQEGEKTNQNWTSYSNTCSKCGGKVEMKLKEIN